MYDVVWSDGRKPGADGKLPPVGNMVDVANAIWTNTIGAPELITVWKDADFDPALKAFTTSESLRFRRRAGPRMTPSTMESRWHQKSS